MRSDLKTGLPRSQWRYIRHWIILTVAVETMMLIFNTRLPGIYLGVAGLFGAGFLLRVLGRYPGEEEPLILDFSAVGLALGYAGLASWLGDSPWRFLLILCSSGIIIPHLVYIMKEK